MAGHSKRHNIKHRKAAQDAKRSKILAQASKLIQMAAKNGEDPSLNPGLVAALTKAKQVGLGKEAIQKAIDKGAGNISGEELVEIFYEGYGTNGVALYIKCITSNTNRSGSNVKAILTKYGGSMGAPGSVAWQFQQKGDIYVNGSVTRTLVKGQEVASITPLDEDAFEHAVMATHAEDYEIEDGIGNIITSKDDFMMTVNDLEAQGWHIDEADLMFVADTTIVLGTEEEEKLQRLLDALEEDEDVDTIWHNAG